MKNLFIGLMSGTSLDGIDAVIVDFGEGTNLIAHHHQPFTPEMHSALLHITRNQNINIIQLGELDIALGKCFAEACNTLLKKAGVSSEDIVAIGSHGQTIHHHPNSKHPFTLQIGDPNTIAALTNIKTIGDFRRKDMALGGQGAPLAPAFHRAMFQEKQPCAVVNIGGIANITLLEQNKITGFDTGPGNTLMDAWIRTHQQKPYDKSGNWAHQGKVIPKLLEQCLADAFFETPPPKSTGPEYFNLNWLRAFLSNEKPEDVQRTLLELTAASIAKHTRTLHHHFEKASPREAKDVNTLFICGGGAHNHFLLERLHALTNATIQKTDDAGIPADWLEAMAFAWMAKQTLEGRTSNLPDVTGASRAAVLGAVYY